MHVLISNDDGIGAPGLRCLVQAFAQAGHRVTVAAPDGQRSAASHSITLFRPLTLRRAEWAAANVEAWAIDGTPADCVKFALDRLVPAVDAVVSGVNDGYNIGTDVHYSGTVAAAMEGAFAGVPAIAVSAPHGREDLMPLAAREALQAAQRLDAKRLPHMTTLNINVPDCAADRIRGRRAASLARLRYEDGYVEHQGTDMGPCYRLTGAMAGADGGEDSDFALLAQGYITYTVLHFDLGMPGEAERFLQE